MKQYVIDELRLDDYKKLKEYFDQNFKASRLQGLYKINIDNSLLSKVQLEHTECQPFYIAVDLEEERLALELLVRSSKKIRCNCISYTTKEQLAFFINMIDSILEKLEIIT